MQIAPYNGGGGYGTPFVINSSNTMTISQDMITDRALGNSKVTDLETQLIGTTVQLDTAGFDYAMLKVFTGIATAASGSDTVLPINNALLPYFGVIAQVLPSPPGDYLFFFPYCKVTKAWTYNFAFGKIIVPKFSFEAIQDPTLGYMLQPYKRASSALAITFPPTV